MRRYWLISLLIGLAIASAWGLWQGWAIGQALTPGAPEGGRIESQPVPDSLGGEAWPLRATPFDPDSFRQPGLAYRPWVRWYWAGSGPEDVEIIETLQRLYDQGAGGVEIYPSGRDLQQAQARAPQGDWAGAFSWRFYRQLLLALRVATSRGLGIDLHLGLGQPAGAAIVGSAASVETLVFGEAQVLGGKWIDMPLPRPRIPGSYYLGVQAARQARLVPQPFLAAEAQPLAVFAARRREASRAWPALDLQDMVRLDPDSVFQLGECPPEDGRLRWQAPPGYWTLIVIYHMPAGARPGHPLGTGFVIDYLDSTRLKAYHHSLLAADSALRPFWGRSLRGFSHEDLRLPVERHYSPGILDFFREKRGYPLEPWLPVLLYPGADHADMARQGYRRAPEYWLDSTDARIRHDYALTVSEWFMAHYVPPVRQWAARRGLHVRSQTYGAELDLITAAARSDIPETGQDYAGGSLMFTKLASAGAWWGGRPLLSAEVGGFAGRRGSLTPQKMKVAADKLFAAGVNHLVTLGEAATLPGTGEPGWQPGPAGAGRLNPRGAFAEAMPALNQYLARCQYLLRQGRPAVDVWIYYPFLGFPPAWAGEAGHEEFLFGGRLPDMDQDEALAEAKAPWPLPQATDPRVTWLQAVWPLIQALDARGISWSWVNDGVIQDASWDEEGLQSGALPGQLIILPELPHIAWETAHQLVSLARAGAPVVVYGEPPRQQPGYWDHAARDAMVQSWMSRLASPVRPRQPGELANWLLALPDRRPVAYAEPLPRLAHLRREWPGGAQLLFFANQENQDRTLVLRPARDFGHAYWLDPWTGDFCDLGPVSASSRLQHWLTAYGAGFLLLSDQSWPGSTDPASRSFSYQALPALARVAVRTLREWEVVAAGPDVKGGLFTRRDTGLFDWRAQEALRYTGTEANYAHIFVMGDTLPGHRYILDLGRVSAVAEVRVNTAWAGTCWLAPYRLDITPHLNPGLNTVEVWVRPPLRNRWVGYARQGKPGYAAYADQPLLPGGLLGPVRLWEVKRTASGIGR